jgi:anti-anti-sigma regulatory factor
MAPPCPRAIVFDLRSIRQPHLGTVGLLARIRLVAGRLGLELRLTNASRELRELIVLAGLEQVLVVEAGGQPEEREQPLGVEEERELGDPAGG